MARKGGRAAVEVDGAPELRRAFRKLDGRLDDLKDLSRDAAEVVEDRADKLVPVLTGKLRGTLRTTASAKVGAVLAGGRTMVPYAGPIHFGWRARNIAPQPFLYDALDDRRDEVVRVYSEGVANLVHRFDREAPD